MIIDLCEATVTKKARHSEAIFDTFEHSAFVKVALRQPGFLDDHGFAFLELKKLIAIKFPGLDERISTPVDRCIINPGGRDLAEPRQCPILGSRLNIPLRYSTVHRRSIGRYWSGIAT
jgi:hypothetical protein